MPYRRTDIAAAADRTLAHLLRVNRGELAPSFRAAWKLAFRCGVHLHLVTSVGPFEAELSHDAATGRWTIHLNARASERRRIRYVIHELAEYVCRTCEPDFAGLYDGLPGSRTCHYRGGDAPQDVRHRVALQTERMYVQLLRQRPATFVVGRVPQGGGGGK